MARAQDAILDALAEHETLTTDELLDQLAPTGERLRAKKRLLYHLGELEKRGEIVVVTRRAHGLKVYRRAGHTSFAPITRTAFEDQGLFTRAYEAEWGRSVDSVLIDCTKTRGRTVERMLLSGRVSDAVCLLDPAPDDERLLEAIGRRSHELVVNVSLSLAALSAWDEAEQLPSLAKSGAITIIRAATSEIGDLTYRAAILKSIELAIEHGTEWYVQNLDAHEEPMFIGRVGPHTFETGEFDSSEAKLIVCAQNTYCVDVNRFLRQHQLSELRPALLASMEALGQTNTEVRARIDDILPEEFIESNTLSAARTYVRFWNYGLKQPDIEQETVLMLLESTKETLENFATAQETIYTSCGMPLRFRLCFSPLFSQAIPRAFSPKRFPRLEIASTAQLMSEPVNAILRDRERAFKLLSGGDRVRIHRRPDVGSETVLREALWLHKTYSLPLLCYAFRADAARTLLDFA